MGDDTITLVSTSDSDAEVQAALTGTPVATPAAEKPAETPAKPEEKPAEKPADAATPAATEKPAEPATPENETAEQKTAREAEAARVNAREKRKNKIQKEIDDLTTAKYNARRDADAEEARLAQLKREREQLETETAVAKAKPAAAAADTVVLAGEPTLEDKHADGSEKYRNYEEFQSAHAKWAIKAATEAAEAAAKKVAKETEDKLTKAERERIDRESVSRAEQDALAKHVERLEEFRKTHVDFDDLIEDVAPAIADIKEELGADSFNVIDRFTIHDSSNGPALVHYLAQHTEEMRAIAAKPVPQQLIALAKIDARLEAASKTGPAPVVAPVTRAPEPIKPVGTTPTASSVAPEDEDYRTYANRRNREERERMAGAR